MEIMIAVAIGVILLAAGLIALDPVGQLAKARNSQRILHLQAILNAIEANTKDTRTGAFTCAAGALPSSTKRMASAGTSSYHIAPCLVPHFIQRMPFDPATSSAYYNDINAYDTGYYLLQNSSGAITLSAPAAELGQQITVTR